MKLHFPSSKSPRKSVSATHAISAEFFVNITVSPPVHIAYSTGRSLLIISHVVSDKVNHSFLGVWGQVFSDAIAIVSIIVSYNSCSGTRVFFVLQKELPLFRETTPFYALFAHFRASALSVSIFAPRSASCGIIHLAFYFPPCR